VLPGQGLVVLCALDSNEREPLTLTQRNAEDNPLITANDGMQTISGGAYTCVTLSSSPPNQTLPTRASKHFELLAWPDQNVWVIREKGIRGIRGDESEQQRAYAATDLDSHTELVTDVQGQRVWRDLDPDERNAQYAITLCECPPSGCAPYDSSNTCGDNECPHCQSKAVPCLHGHKYLVIAETGHEFEHWVGTMDGSGDQQQANCVMTISGNKHKKISIAVGDHPIKAGEPLLLEYNRMKGGFTIPNYRPIPHLPTAFMETVPPYEPGTAPNQGRQQRPNETKDKIEYCGFYIRPGDTVHFYSPGLPARQENLISTKVLRIRSREDIGPGKAPIEFAVQLVIDDMAGIQSVPTH
jgi:hypothetical protein